MLVMTNLSCFNHMNYPLTNKDVSNCWATCCGPSYFQSTGHDRILEIHFCMVQFGLDSSLQAHIVPTGTFFLIKPNGKVFLVQLVAIGISKKIKLQVASNSFS